MQAQRAFRDTAPRVQLLFLLAAANALAFAAWQALLNNFAVEQAAFDDIRGDEAWPCIESSSTDGRSARVRASVSAAIRADCCRDESSR